MFVIHLNIVATEYRLPWNGNIIFMPSLLFLLRFFLYLKNNYGMLRLLLCPVFCQMGVIFLNSAKSCQAKNSKKNKATVMEISSRREFVVSEIRRKKKDILKEKFLLCTFICEKVLYSQKASEFVSFEWRQLSPPFQRFEDFWWPQFGLHHRARKLSNLKNFFFTKKFETLAFFPANFFWCTTPLGTRREPF